MDPCIDLLVEFVEGAPEGAGKFREFGEDSAEAGTQESVIESGEEQSDTQAEVSEAVTMGAGDALNELVESKSAQVIGHLPGGERARVEA